MVIDLTLSAWFGTGLIVTRDSIISQARNLSNLRCGLDRARGSVRRASGFVQIAFALKPLDAAARPAAGRTEGANLR